MERTRKVCLNTNQVNTFNILFICGSILQGHHAVKSISVTMTKNTNHSLH